MNNKEFILGKITEKTFSELFTSVTPSTKEEDMCEHWDMKIDARIDVKGLKKDARHDASVNENFHWVELINVNGDVGSLSAENMDFLAFELMDYWLIIDRIKLKDFIKEKCKGKKLGTSKDFYELYQRPNKKDMIVKVKSLDLCFLADKMIKKNTTPL